MCRNAVNRYQLLMVEAAADGVEQSCDFYLKLSSDFSAVYVNKKISKI